MNRSIVVLGLLLLCVLQTVLIGRQGRSVWNEWKTTRGMDNHERRVRLWGDFYREILRMQSQIPRDALVRWESNEYPWYSAYYLYPRLLTPAQNADPKKAWTLRYTKNGPAARMEAQAP